MLDRIIFPCLRYCTRFEAIILRIHYRSLTNMVVVSTPPFSDTWREGPAPTETPAPFPSASRHRAISSHAPTGSRQRSSGVRLALTNIVVDILHSSTQDVILLIFFEHRYVIKDTRKCMLMLDRIIFPCLRYCSRFEAIILRIHYCSQSIIVVDIFRGLYSSTQDVILLLFFEHRYVIKDTRKCMVMLDRISFPCLRYCSRFKVIILRIHYCSQLSSIVLRSPTFLIWRWQNQFNINLPL